MGILDVNNAIRISVLHFVFGPRIQKILINGDQLITIIQ